MYSPWCLMWGICLNISAHLCHLPPSQALGYPLFLYTCKDHWKKFHQVHPLSQNISDCTSSLHDNVWYISFVCHSRCSFYCNFCNLITQMKKLQSLILESLCLEFVYGFFYTHFVKKFFHIINTHLYWICFAIFDWISLIYKKYIVTKVSAFSGSHITNF